MFDFNNSANAIQQNQTMLNSYFQNLQNQFTPGYKAESVQFNDIMGQTMGGGGAKTQSNGIIFSQGLPDRVRHQPRYRRSGLLHGQRR